MDEPNRRDDALFFQDAVVCFELNPIAQGDLN
jgi:hypothetical protein